MIAESGPDGLRVEAPKSTGSLELGGSVNVSGVCLSVSELHTGSFTVALSPETRVRSTLGGADAGTPVNIELPLRVGDPLDGHLVQGHVEAIGKVARVSSEGSAMRVWIRPPDRARDQ